MKRLLTASVALVLANTSIAPVFAESLPQQTNPATKQQLTNPATKQQLTNPATKQQLIVPEGQVMTDAELAKVEGELFRPSSGLMQKLAMAITRVITGRR